MKIIRKSIIYVGEDGNVEATLTFEPLLQSQELELKIIKLPVIASRYIDSIPNMIWHNFSFSTVIDETYINVEYVGYFPLDFAENEVEDIAKEIVLKSEEEAWF